MTEDDFSRFELYALVAHFEEVSLISLGLFLTIISGFLVMAYAIGDKLTRRQCWVVIPVFVLSATMTMMNWLFLGAVSAWFYPANYFKPGRSANPREDILSGHTGMEWSHISTFVMGLMIIGGALIFFRDIRKNAAAKLAAESGSEQAAVMEAPEEPANEPVVSEPQPEEVAESDDEDGAASEPAKPD